MRKLVIALSAAGALLAFSASSATASCIPSAYVDGQVTQVKSFPFRHTAEIYYQWDSTGEVTECGGQWSEAIIHQDAVGSAWGSGTELADNTHELAEGSYILTTPCATAGGQQYKVDFDVYAFSSGEDLPWADDQFSTPLPDC